MSNNLNNIFIKNDSFKKEFIFKDNKVVVEFNTIANQTEQTILIKWNETVSLITLCVGSEPTSGSFLPLSVEFQENLYSVGKIPGSFLKREGKPSDFCVLSSRLIDRSIRNLFPKNFRNEIQIIVSPLSVDYSIDIRTISIIAVSLALNSSSLPINVKFSSVVVGIINDEFIINPSSNQMNDSILELFLTGTKEEINMIEMSGKEIPEETILKAIKLGHEYIKETIFLQEKLLENLKITKKEYIFKNFDEDKLKEEIILKFNHEINDLIENSSNEIRIQKTKNIEKLVKNEFLKLEKYNDIENFSEKLLNCLWDIFKEKVRKYTINNKKRIDGRDFDTIRNLSAKIDFLPIVHSSAIFNRGQTQTLSILTLGPISDKQIIDNITKQEDRFFLHHYKALPYSVGQVAWLRGVSRREIGHGFLVEKAFKWIIPNIEEFPYTIRIVSDVLSSNGSSSQASICSASLSLLAAGVPVKSQIAGIATGLIKEVNEYNLLSDIQAWEDFFGDMDFKVAGSKKGICAIQVDLKISGLPINIIEKILNKSKIDRLKVLNVLNNIIEKPRANLSKNAIKFRKINVEIDDIGKVVGPSGKNIKKIISDTNQTSIDINDDGTIFIYHKDLEMIEKAIEMIKNSKNGKNGKNGGNVEKLNIGDEFVAKVTKIVDFGIFVNKIDTNTSGLVHVSNLSDKYIRKIEDFITLNEKVKVKVIDINEKKQLSLKLLKKIK